MKFVDVEIREAAIGDADVLGAVHIQCWREAYFPHILSAASFEVATPAVRAERWRTILATPSNVKNWVAEHDGRIIGFAAAGEGRESDLWQLHELYSIYVLAEAHGTGVGQALLDAALGEAPAYLWVAAENPRAQAFYRRNRFAPDGTTKTVTFIRDTIDELRMVRG